MNRLGTVSEYFKLFAQLGEIFEARFLSLIWQKYPSRESDAWDAIGLFIDGYAFTRQGARPDYSHVGLDVVRELKLSSQSMTDEHTAQLAWHKFSKYLNEQDLNHANNPLCPERTGYYRNYKGTKYWTFTKRKSVIELLAAMAKSGLHPNIVVFAQNGLALDHVKSVYTTIREINGIDQKIASLFLRDVAIFYDVIPSKDRHLLQPVDVWVRRTYDLLMSKENTNVASIEKIQRWILQESIICGVRPEVVNEGIWYYSSQVAGSNYRMSKALNDLGFTKALLDEHIKAVQQEAKAVESIP